MLIVELKNSLPIKEQAVLLFLSLSVFVLCVHIIYNSFHNNLRASQWLYLYNHLSGSEQEYKCLHFHFLSRVSSISQISLSSTSSKAVTTSTVYLQRLHRKVKLHINHVIYPVLQPPPLLPFWRLTNQYLGLLLHTLRSPADLWTRTLYPAARVILVHCPLCASGFRRGYPRG